MTWALLVVGLINVVLGIVVYKNTKKGAERGIFLAMLLSTAGWAWGIALFLIAASLTRAQAYVDLYYTAALCIAASMLSFAMYRSGTRVKLSLLLPYLPPLFLALTFLGDTGWLVRVHSLTGTLTERVAVDPETYIAYAVAFLFMSVYAIILLYRQAFAEKGLLRKRQLVIANGVVAASGFGVIFNLFLPGLGVYDFIAVGPLFSIIFAVATTYSVFRYSLFDLRRSFVTSFTYLLSFAAILLVYGGVTFSINRFLSEGVKDPQAIMIAQVFVVVVASAAFSPIKRLFDMATHRIFFRNDYDSHEVLNELSRIASRHIALAPLATRTLRLLSDKLQTTFAQIIILDKKGEIRFQHLFGAHSHDMQRLVDDITHLFQPLDEIAIIDQLDDEIHLAKTLQKAGMAAAAEMRTSRGIVGYMVLGDKKSGVTFSKKDKDLLQVAASEIALAVENSLRYDEVERFNETLSERVEEATKELRMSNKRLKQMDQTKDEFISLTSHQLRTPLTTVKGYISMLLDGDAGELNPQQRRLLEEAFNSSQRMVHLISDFLNISRIQTGKFEIELSETDLSEVLDEEIDQLRQSAASRGITLQYERPSEFPLIQIDESKIRQVIMNFIDNAIYYSSSGTTVRIVLAASRDTVEFRVIDQGIGVPANEQHKLFSKFSRASNAKKQRPDGTGIGLFMAKKVVVALGGAIIFQSKEGQGSTFGFRLNR
jgi:signal transduction histidine kinase